MTEDMGCIEVGGKIFWECGCITYKKGDTLVTEACDRRELCPVVKTVHEASNERDIPITHHRREEFDRN